MSKFDAIFGNDIKLQDDLYTVGIGNVKPLFRRHELIEPVPEGALPQYISQTIVSLPRSCLRVARINHTNPYCTVVGPSIFIQQFFSYDSATHSMNCRFLPVYESFDDPTRAVAVSIPTVAARDIYARQADEIQHEYFDRVSMLESIMLLSLLNAHTPKSVLMTTDLTRRAIVTEAIHIAQENNIMPMFLICNSRETAQLEHAAETYNLTICECDFVVDEWFIVSQNLGQMFISLIDGEGEFRQVADVHARTFQISERIGMIINDGFVKCRLVV